MRIAMFTETFLPSTDGVVTRLCRTLEALGRLGHEVLVLAPEGGPETYAGMRVEGFPGRPFFLYPDKRVVWPRLRAFDLVQSFRPDVIHAVNPAVFGMGAIAAAWATGVPLVASYHTHFAHFARLYGLGWLEPAIWGYMRLLHNRAAINLCTSRATLEELRRRGFRRLRLWPRAVDERLFHVRPPDPAMRARLAGGEPERTVLLFVGRFAPEKEIGRLLPLVRELPDTVLALVGDGPSRRELERTFAGTRTVFTGYLHGEELASAYASADAFVFPSRHETLGFVLLEAMATGLPVVAAASPASRELLGGGGGLLYDPDRPAELVEAVRRLLASPELRARLRAEAVRQAQTQGWEAATRQLVRFYDEAIELARVALDPLARLDGAGVQGG